MALDLKLELALAGKKLTREGFKCIETALQTVEQIVAATLEDEILSKDLEEDKTSVYAYENNIKGFYEVSFEEESVTDRVGAINRGEYLR